MRDLLAEDGSIYVHCDARVQSYLRLVLDEIFGKENVIVSIPVKKKGSQKGGLLDPVNDYLVWAVKNKQKIKYQQLYFGRDSDEEITSDFSNVKFSNGSETTLSKLEAADKVPSGTYKSNLQTLFCSGSNHEADMRDQKACSVPASSYHGHVM